MQNVRFDAQEKMAHLEREQDQAYWEGMLEALNRGAEVIWIDDNGLPEQTGTDGQ